MIQKRQKKKLADKIFSFEMLAFCGILVIVFFGFNLVKEYYREYQIKSEINSLKGDLEALEKNNYELSKTLEYFKTDEFRESEARKKLNMKKDGEKVVIIKPGMIDESAKSETKKEEEKKENLPNYKKWWYYFFATKGK